MKNKQLYLLSLFATGLFLQAPANASPLVSIGDNADLFFNGSSSVRWQSNIFRDEDDEVDDFLWIFSPGFELNVGRGLSNADFSIITRYDILRYKDESQLDTEEFHITAMGSYQGSRLVLDGSVSYDQEQSTSGDANADGKLIEYDLTTARLNSEYTLSPKFSLGAGVSYSDKEYTKFSDNFADRETWTVPLDVYYELTPKVDLSVGYSYSNTDVDSTIFVDSYTNERHFFNVGARGQLLPKLTGFFKIGYTMNETDQKGADDHGMLGLDADLTWVVTPKFTAGLGLSRDFGASGEGQTTENSSVDLTGSYSISSFFAASVNLGYTYRDYTETSRSDNQYDMGARLSYTPNQYWNFSTGYTYSENDSDARDQSYQNHIIDFNASLRY